MVYIMNGIVLKESLLDSEINLLDLWQEDGARYIQCSVFLNRCLYSCGGRFHSLVEMVSIVGNTWEYSNFLQCANGW